MFTYGQVVTIVRRTVSGQDEFGNDVYGSAQESVSSCVVQPASSRESLNLTDQLTSTITVFLPPGTDLSYIDAIILDGVQYEVNGVPDAWTSPWSGMVAPVRIAATMVEGAST